jgi:hypothetical protein
LPPVEASTFTACLRILKLIIASSFRLSDITLPFLELTKIPSFTFIRPTKHSEPPFTTYALSQSDTQKLELALQKNSQGVEALTFNDGPGALKAFSEAISRMIDLLSQIPGDRTIKPSIERNLAIMYANRAGAKLMGGDAIDAHSALRDAQMAEQYDPSLNLA